MIKSNKMTAEPIKFETIEQILADKKCIQLLQEKIDSIRTHRKELLDAAKAGRKLKRGPFDVLDECAMLYPTELTAEFLLIKAKSSKLAAKEREFITLMVSQAISVTIKFYEAAEQAKKVRQNRKKRFAVSNKE